MLAAEFDAFGTADVLRVRHAPRPAADPGTVVIRVAACSVNPKDSFIRKGRFAALTGTRFPMRVGFDFAGTITEVGEEVAAFALGNRVWGMLNGWHGGACAELAAVPADAIAMMPAALDFVTAAAMPLAALTALQALRDMGGLAATSQGPSQRVLITAAAGGVGLFGVQLAKAMGAHVTALASAANEELCRTFGADEFIARDNGTQLSAERYDLFLDTFGAWSFADAAHHLSHDGVFVSTVPSRSLFEQQSATPGAVGRRARLVAVRGNTADLDRLAALSASGKLRAHIDAVYALPDIRAAHRHIEAKRTRGKVIVAVE